MAEPLYYAVVFTSLRHPQAGDGYGEMADRMERLAREQPGFRGVESARGEDGIGITISYWDSLEDVAAWGRHAEHLLAQKFGREKWYESYTLRVSAVLHVRDFARPRTKADGPPTSVDEPS
jgi:heme-degrading monooxygenase HmoA